MATDMNRKIQYLAGACASSTFLFTGASLAWSSPAIPKFKNGANLDITDGPSSDLITMGPSEMGPFPTKEDFFKSIQASWEHTNKNQISWVVSLLGLGALFGCYCGQVLTERVGRRRTIFGASVPALMGAGVMVFTKLPELMYIARLLIGLSTGIVAVVTMIYVTEISDKEIRGSLGMIVQVMNNLGSLIIYSIGPFVSYTVLNSLILSIPICYVLLCIWIPESPYYHLKDGRVDAARKEFKRLRATNDEKWIDDEMALIKAHVRESMENKSTVKELLTNVKYRKALYIVGGLKLLQYMTGILVIQSYLEVIFRQSSSVSGPLASIVYGFVQLAAGICATFLTRYVGRRMLMFTSCLGVSLSMTILGTYFYLQDTIKVSPETLSSLTALPLIGILGFNICYANGIGNLPYVMQAELFPVNVKGVASSLATMFACVLCFVVTKFYQTVKDSFGHYTVFSSFALVGYTGVFFIYFFVPETRGKTLEEVLDNVQDAGKSPEEEALRSDRDNQKREEN